MSIPKKTILAIVSLTAAVLLTACSGNNNQGTNANSQSQDVKSQSSQSASSSNTESSSSQANSSKSTQTSNLDGSYKATDHDGDQHLLQINGASGTWTETEVDGSKEIKQVQVDATNQRLIVGDDVKTYQQNGNQLTVSELDDDPDTLNCTEQ